MNRIFVDTNIVIDLLAKRQEYETTAEMFSLGDRGELTIIVSSLTFSHLQYILRKILKEKTLPALRDLELIVTIASVGEKVIKLALNDDDFKDFEDAIQYYSAIESESDIIITRNLNDFKKSRIPVMTSSQFINSRKK